MKTDWSLLSNKTDSIILLNVVSDQMPINAKIIKSLPDSDNIPSIEILLFFPNYEAHSFKLKDLPDAINILKRMKTIPIIEIDKNQKNIRQYLADIYI